MTIQQLTSNQPTADISSGAPDAPISESLITQLAAEFFSALPKQNPQGFNFDLPSHQPQPRDPIAALSGRVPAIVQQTNLNPASTQHFMEPTSDHPERRILSSAPVIGGANTPDPLAATHGLDLLFTPSAVVQQAAPATTSSNAQSSYYFLDLPKPDVVNPQTVNTQSAQVDVLKNPYAFDNIHVTDDHQLRSVLQDRNDKPATAESGY